MLRGHWFLSKLKKGKTGSLKNIRIVFLNFGILVIGGFNAHSIL